MYTGPRRTGNYQICTVSSTNAVQIGQLVAINCENYAEDPAIGKCVAVEDTRIKVEWMKGTYTSSWKAWMITDTTNKRKKAPWIDWIPRESIILFDFELSAAGRLRKRTIEHLKKIYAELSASLV